MQIHIVLQQRGWSGQTRDLSLWFLSRPFFFYFIVWFAPSPTSAQILTIFMSYVVIQCKEMPFGGCFDTAPHLRGHIPQKTLIFMTCIGVFQPKLQNVKTAASIETKFCTMLKPLNTFHGWS